MFYPMTDAITTKPGDKYASIRLPALYEQLRARGYSKGQAARISNAQARKYKKTAYPDQSQFAGYTMEDWDDTKPDSFFHAGKRKRKMYTVKDLEYAVEHDYAPVTVDAIAAQCDELPRLKGEQISPGVTRIRGNLCNVHGKYGRCPGASVAPPKAAVAKPKKGSARKPVKTPEQRQDEADAKKKQNQDAVAAALTGADASLGPTGVAAVLAAASGGQIDAAMGGDLEKIGYAQKNPDGSYRLTSEARALASAAARGDTRAALDADGRAQERAAKLGKVKPAKPEKPPKSGGGGGKAKPEKPEQVAKPTDDEKRQQRTQERVARADETAAKVGIGAADVANLRAAAEGTGTTGDAAELTRLGLVENGEATDQGRRALLALERGDVRGYNAALQDAKSRQGRESAASGRRSVAERRRAEVEQRRSETERKRQEREAATEARRAEAERRRNAPKKRRTQRRETHIVKSFAVFKQADGRHRWVAFSSNAYRDRDKEIVSTKALADDCARADTDGNYGPLRWWHTPGVDIGICDFNAMHGRILVESGTFKDARIGALVSAKAADLQMSIGFVHPPNEPDTHGVFHHIRRFERSLVPRGRAANPFTHITVKEPGMASLKESWGAFVALFDGDEQQAKQYAIAAETKQKEADDGGIVYKDAPDWAQALIGRMEALEAREKALPPPVAAEEELPVEIEAKIDGEEPMVEEEEPGGLTLSPEDITAIGNAVVTALQSALGPLVGAMDMTNKMGSAMADLKAMMGGYQGAQSTKDDARAKEIADLTARLKELEGDQPAAFKGHRITDNPVVSEARRKELLPEAVLSDDPFGDIIAKLNGSGANIPGS